MTKEKVIRQAQKELMVFEFSESRTPIRNVLVENEPYFIGSDVASALGYQNSRKALKDHCRYVTKCSIPHPQNNQKSLEVSVIPESDLYRLIIKSELPSAEKFERWVMEDVLPSIRKKGYYHLNTSKAKGDYIDARDIPFQTQPFNNHTVRVVSLNGMPWIVINDITTAISARTGSYQIAKKLNNNQTLAKKIWLYGNTHPAWCTNELGVKLILAGSRALKNVNQLTLSI